MRTTTAWIILVPLMLYSVVHADGGDAETPHVQRISITSVLGSNESDALQLKADPPSISISTVSHGDFRATLEFTNDTGLRLTPSRVELSCGCASGKHSAQSIQPSQIFSVDLQITRKNYRKRTSSFTVKSVFEESDIPLNLEVAVTRSVNAELSRYFSRANDHSRWSIRATSQSEKLEESKFLGSCVYSPTFVFDSKMLDERTKLLILPFEVAKRGHDLPINVKCSDLNVETISFLPGETNTSSYALASSVDEFLSDCDRSSATLTVALISRSNEDVSTAELVDNSGNLVSALNFKRIGKSGVRLEFPEQDLPSFCDKLAEVKWIVLNFRSGQSLRISRLRSS